MVREALLPKKDLLEYSTEEKEEKIKETFELSDEDLDEIRGQRYVKDQALRAVEVLDQKDLEEQSTFYNIAALVYEDWDNTDSKSASLNQALRNRYKQERDAVEDTKDLDITYMHLLRQDAGAYDGNLLEARSHYDNFENSHQDLLRSVTIPIEINMAEAELLGIYWRDGSFSNPSEKMEFSLNGGSNDFDFYDKIKKDIQDIHNLNVGIKQDKKRNTIKETEIEAEIPSISVDSKAICTWLADDLNMLVNKETSVPEIEWNSEQEAGFLKGSLSASGGITQHGAYVISSSDIEDIEFLSKLAEGIGLSHETYNREHSERGTEYTELRIPKEQTEELHEYGFFKNPSHEEELERMLE